MNWFKQFLGIKDNPNRNYPRCIASAGFFNLISADNNSDEFWIEGFGRCDGFKSQVIPGFRNAWIECNRLSDREYRGEFV